MRFFIYFLFVSLTSIVVNCTPTHEVNQDKIIQRKEVLDDKYTVEWEVDLESQIITFHLTVETLGYVGFGISLGGKMDGADIIIGGVDSKTSEHYFGDYMGKLHSPTPDEETNWILVSAIEEDKFTKLTVQRPLDTCDLNDIAITRGTVKLIWAIGETDELVHHQYRGATAANLLDIPGPPLDLTQFENVTMTNHLELNASRNTIYWCTIFEYIPKGKSHVIAFEPILTSEAATKHTHHFVLNICRAPDDENASEFFGRFAYPNHPGASCWDPSDDGFREIHALHCKSVFYAWTFGGRMLALPENLGIPWGENGPTYYMLETHLDNPDNLGPEVKFETGVAIYHTEVERPTEAGLLSIGHPTSFTITIPPNTPEFTIVGHCSSDCNTKHLPKEGVNLFNANLHAHKAARKMKVRHFRENKELPWIVKDDTFDFDFQESRPLQNEVKFLPGDHITIECTYDTTSRSVSTIGGWSTYDEMCSVVLLYYPLSPLELCWSAHSNDNLAYYFNITEYTIPEYEYDPTIIEPAKWAGKTYKYILDNEINWTPEEIQGLQEELKFGVQDSICNYVEEGVNATKYPEIDEEYQEISTCSPDTITTPVTPVTTTSGPDTTPKPVTSGPDTTPKPGGSGSSGSDAIYTNTIIISIGLAAIFNLAKN